MAKAETRDWGRKQGIFISLYARIGPRFLRAGLGYGVPASPRTRPLSTWGGAARAVVKGKRRLLLSRWLNLNTQKRRRRNALFALNRRVMKAYLLKESLDRLWSYRYEGAMLRYLNSWIDQLRWQRLKPMEKLADMLLNHLEGILNYCRTKVRLGVVEAVNGNIKALLRRGRGVVSRILCKRLSSVGVLMVGHG